MKEYYVYIMASKRNGTLYIGVTSDLIKRVYQHKNKLIEGFSSKYNTTTLVYYEKTNDVEAALKREKQLKGITRAKKIALIVIDNKDWNDLSASWY